MVRFWCTSSLFSAETQNKAKLSSVPTLRIYVQSFFFLTMYFYVIPMCMKAMTCVYNKNKKRVHLH